MCALGRVKQFSAVYSGFQVKVRSKKVKLPFSIMSTKRCLLDNQMQFEFKNPMVSSVLLCDVGTCSNVHLNYKQFSIVSLTRKQKNEMPYKSANKVLQEIVFFFRQDV